MYTTLTKVCFSIQKLRFSTSFSNTLQIPSFEFSTALPRPDYFYSRNESNTENGTNNFHQYQAGYSNGNFCSTEHNVNIACAEKSYNQCQRNQNRNFFPGYVENGPRNEFLENPDDRNGRMLTGFIDHNQNNGNFGVYNGSHGNYTLQQHGYEHQRRYAADFQQNSYGNYYHSVVSPGNLQRNWNSGYSGGSHQSEQASNQGERGYVGSLGESNLKPNEESEVVLKEELKGTVEELDKFYQECKLKEVINVLGLLEKQHIPVDLPRYLLLFKRCCEEKALEEGKSIHEHLLRSGLYLELKILNKILVMYCSCGSLDDAYKVFDKMPSRNLTTWDTMISFLAENGHGEDAIALFTQFKETGLKPDGTMFLGIFSACGVVGDAVEGLLHFESMKKDYFIVPSMEHYISVVDMLGTAGNLNEALEFIEMMPLEPSIEVWEMLMYLCRMHGNLELGNRCAECVQVLDPSHLDEQSRAGYLPLRPFGSAKDKEQKKSGQSFPDDRSRVHEYRAGDRSQPELYDLLRWMRQQLKEGGYSGVTPVNWHQSQIGGTFLFPQSYHNAGNPGTYNTGFSNDNSNVGVIQQITGGSYQFDAGFCHHTSYQCQRGYEGSFGQSSMRPNEESEVVLEDQPKGTIESLKEAVYVLGLLEEQHISVDLTRYLLLFKVCCEEKALEEGKSIHEHLLRSGLHLELNIYNKILEMYCSCGSLDDAFEVFDKIPNRNLTTWDTMISFLAKNGHGEEAIALFAQFKKTGLRPDGTMFMGIFSACGAVGDTVEGLLHFESMKNNYSIVPSMEQYISVVDMLGTAGNLDEALEFIEKMPLEPSIEVWEVLMNLCRMHGNLELGDRCAEVVEVLDPLHLDEQSRAGYLPLKPSDSAKDKEKKNSGQSFPNGRHRVHKYRAGESHDLLREMKQHLKEAGYIPEVKFVPHDIDPEGKEEALMAHDERLAVVQGLMTSPARYPIRIIKNLRICVDCHNTMKIVSKLVGRELIIRDAKRFHHFKDGLCSCRDYW